MQFYCPNCQTTYESEASAQVTTKFNQVFAKSACSICHTECVAKISHTNSSNDQEITASNTIDEAAVLKEFESVT